MRNRPYPLYDVPYIPDIRTMLERLAKTAPDEIGFQFTNNKDLITKSHKDVLDDTEALTSFLISKGYLETNIAIIGANSYEWLIAFFAIVCSGNIAVAIDAQLPSETISSMLEDTDCKAVFVSEKCRDKISSYESGIAFGMHKISDLIVSSADKANNIKTDPEASAAVFFTSGTTGKSKGVVLSQKNIMYNIWESRLQVEIKGTVLSILPYHHTLGLIIGVFAVYCYGCPIYICKSFKRIKQDFQTYHPVSLATVPLIIETLYKMIKQETQNQEIWSKIQRASILCKFLMSIGIDIRKKVFKRLLDQFGGNLDFIICGGAALDSCYISFFRSIGIEIITAYGITECSPAISANRNYYYRDGSAGTLYPHMKIKFEEDGEIAVKSDSVMLGYYKNEEETNRVLKDGWFYTGDIGHLDKDGFLWITGRKKNIIVLSNGENISPEEIEMKFIADNAVEEVIVYSFNGHLVAEIYPDSNYHSDDEYFNNLIDKYNSGQPMYRQINELKLRKEPFRKNTSGKILREGIGTL